MVESKAGKLNIEVRTDYIGFHIIISLLVLASRLLLDGQVLQRTGRLLGLRATLGGIGSRQQLRHLCLTRGERRLELLRLLWATKSDCKCLIVVSMI